MPQVIDIAKLMPKITATVKRTISSEFRNCVTNVLGILSSMSRNILVIGSLNFVVAM